MKKSNNTVRRVPIAKGGYATIQTNILLNSKVTDPAKTLLNLLLNNSINWNILLTYYQKKLKWSNDKLAGAIKNLIANGYMIKEKRGHNLYYYTISEYGDLKPKEEKEVISTIDNNIIPTKDKRFIQLIGSADKYLTNNEMIDLVAMLTKDDTVNILIAEDVINSLVKSAIGNQKMVYKKAMILTEKKIGVKLKKPPVKAVTEYKEWLKGEIFTNNNLDLNFGNKWLRIKSKHYTFTTDFETQAHDDAEQRAADGDC